MTATQSQSSSAAGGTTAGLYGPGPTGGQTLIVRRGVLAFLRSKQAWLITLVNLGVFFTLWELIARFGGVSDLFLPQPTEIFAEMWTGFASGLYGPHLLYSLRNLVIGMVLAAAVGIPVGLLMGSVKIVDTILSPYVWAMASLPRVALIPLLILITGFSNTTKLTLIFLSAVFPIMVNCMAGVKTVEPSLLRAGRVFGASTTEMYAKVVFPYTLPFIVSGLNQGLSRGLVGLVIAEIFAGNDGLGYLLSRAGQTFNTPRLFAVLILLAIVAIAFVQTLRWAEVKVAPWRNQRA